MSDQLSKVVAEMRDRANGWRHGAHPAVTAELALEWADRIESAAAPVEVDGRHAEVLRDIRDTEYAPHDEHGGFIRERAALTAAITALADYATLARQLAEAKAGRLTLTQDYCDMRDRAEQAESALAAATRRVDELRDVFNRCVCAMVPAEYANGYREALDHIDAALTKEPTK